MSRSPLAWGARIPTPFIFPPSRRQFRFFPPDALYKVDHHKIQNNICIQSVWEIPPTPELQPQQACCNTFTRLCNYIIAGVTWTLRCNVTRIEEPPFPPPWAQLLSVQPTNSTFSIMLIALEKTNHINRMRRPPLIPPGAHSTAHLRRTFLSRLISPKTRNPDCQILLQIINTVLLPWWINHCNVHMFYLELLLLILWVLRTCFVNDAVINGTT